MRLNIRLLFVISAALIIAAMSVNAQNLGPDPNQPDSIVIDSVVVVSAGVMAVPVFLVNDEQLAGFEISLVENSPDLVIDSFSFAGTRSEYISIKGWTMNGNIMTIYCMPYSTDALLAAGNGPIGNIFFSVVPSVTPQMITIDSSSFAQTDLLYSTVLSDANAVPFAPQFLKGYLDLQLSNCCIGTRGNANGDPAQDVNISDITFLTNYLFGIPSGPAPMCNDEGNVNGDPGNAVNIADIAYLTNYLFGGGPQPPSCP